MADHFIDSLGEMCPIPIIRAEKKIKQIKVKERVVLKTDHSCSISSVTTHFQGKYGYICSVTEEEEGIWRIIIEKTV
jgi:tRNA 2-thiouridine synthesizing protein A